MMMNRRMFLAGSASVAAMLALSACSKNGTDSGGGGDAANQTNPQERSALKQGGELKFSITATIANWNINHVDGNSVNLRNVLDFASPQVLDYAEDGSFSANPDFLTTFEAAEVDGKTVVTIAFNEKAVWGNGRSWSSEDVKASVEHAKDPEYAWASTDGIDKIESVEIVDDLTAKVTFDSIYPDWANAFALQFPKELYVDAETFNKTMAGSGSFNNDYFAGPFKVDSYDTSQQLITLVPNDLWWGEKPLLDKVTFRVLDSAAEATSFANKALDVLDYIISADVYNQAVARSDAEIRQNFGRQWRHFTINASSGPLADKAVRQAIVRACDRESITASDLAGLPVDYKELLTGNRFFLPNQDGYQDNSGEWGYDVEAAKKLLDDAGWTVGADGVREKDGTRLAFVFTIPTGAPTTENEANLLQSQLKEVGMEMTLQTVDTNKYFDEYVNPKNYAITAFTWQATQFPMANIGQIYGATSESNFTGQAVPEVDEYIAKVASTADHDERVRLTNECDALLWENVYNFPIYVRRQLTAVPKNLANFGAVGLASFRAENVGYMA